MTTPVERVDAEFAALELLCLKAFAVEDRCSTHLQSSLVAKSKSKLALALTTQQIELRQPNESMMAAGSTVIAIDDHRALMAKPSAAVERD